MAPPASREAVVAATEVRVPAWLGRFLKWLGFTGGALVATQTRAVDLPDDRTEAMVHIYDGGGVKATGPALLVRKSLADKVSLSGTYYVDMVSNASIDVVTTASPYKENRTEFGLGLDYAVRDALLHVGLTRSHEPDYQATTTSVDLSQEVFGGMTTISMGFARGLDDVGKKGQDGYFDKARHWQWRAGATQILSPRWLASVNVEALADDGYLASPYRVARVFGAAVPERVPRTRSARAVKFRVLGDVGDAGQRSAVRAEYRYYRDTWAIQANTVELGYSRYFGDDWLADGFVRGNHQSKALFYSDNELSETTYVTRNRQLGSFNSQSLGGKLSYHWGQVQQHFDVRLNGAYELVRFKYQDFTDLRTGKPYSFTGHVLQLYMTATF